MSTTHVTGFFHAGVTVRDMDEALRFYRDGLGLEVTREYVTGGEHARRIWALEPGDVKVVFLAVPGSDAVVELFEFPDVERHSASARPPDYGAGHFCLFVDDADAVHAHMAGLGFTSRAGQVTTVGEGPHGGTKVAYLIDPDGYHVEIYEKPQRS